MILTQGLIYPRYLDGNAVCGALGSCALRFSFEFTFFDILNVFTFKHFGTFTSKYFGIFSFPNTSDILYLQIRSKHVKSLSREWTCEECTNGLVQIATIFVQQEYIDDIISFLQVVMMTVT